MISVDLGGSKVVAALGKRSQNNETIVVDVVEVPMDGYTSGEITNIKNVVTAIQSAVGTLESRNSIQVSDVWVSASGKHIVCSDNSGFVYVGGAGGEITEMTVEKLCDNMNNVQAPDSKIILDRIPQNYKVDGNEIIGSPVGHFGHKLSTTFSFTLGGKAALDRINDAFGRSNIYSTHFVTSAMASAMVVASDEEKEAGVAVIDLGAGTTDLCIIQNNVVRYIASIPIGSAAINKDIQTIGVPNNSIERLKVKCGYATVGSIPNDLLNKAVLINTHSQYQKKKSIAYRDLAAIIEARMLDIIEMVNNEIKASGYHNRLANGIILTGGASQMMGIEELFRERTGYDVRCGVAECNISLDSKEDINSPALATAVGLLAIGIEKSNIAPSESEGGYITENVYTPKQTYTPKPEEETPEPNEESQEVDDNYYDSEEEENNDNNLRGYGNRLIDDEDEDYTPKTEPKDKNKGKKRGKFFGKVGEWIFGGDIVDDEL